MSARLAGLALILLVPRLAAAADPAADAVRDALAGFEAVPGAERVRAIPGAEAALRGLARDPAASPVLRARAVVMLGEFRSPATVALLRELTVVPATPEPLRTRAPLALVRTAGAGALPELRAALAATSPWVRVAGARALATLGETGRAELRARLPLERDPRVVLELQRGIAR